MKFSKSDQIRKHLQKKYLIENVIFCAVMSQFARAILHGHCQGKAYRKSIKFACGQPKLRRLDLIGKNISKVGHSKFL